MTTENTCANCAYLKRGSIIHPKTPHECRRFPPNTHLVGMTAQGPMHSNAYPTVDLDLWCGEHKRKEEK